MTLHRQHTIQTTYYTDNILYRHDTISRQQKAFYFRLQLC